MRTCDIDGCKSKHWARGWCNMHYLRWRNHGDPLHLEPPHPLPVMHGADNPKWKGAAAKYSAVHNRVHRLLGPARDRVCPICSAPAAEWAYDHGDQGALVDELTGFRYSANPAHYFAVCRPCHWRLDRQSLPMVVGLRLAAVA